MAQAVDKYYLLWVASALPGLFHLSIFLFLAGHVMSLSNINHAVFMVVFTCVVVCAVLYLCLSLSPILRYDSPYYSPLSSLIWSCMVGIPWLILKSIYRVTERLNIISYRTRLRVLDLARIFHQRTFLGMMKEVEDLAQTRALELDTPAISRTFESLEGDQDMVKFLDNIPGFYESTEVEKDTQVLEHLHSTQLPSAIVSFMDQSWSSSLLLNEKRRRVAICLRAINADPLLLQCTFRQTLQSMRSSIFKSIDFVLGVASHKDNSDPWTKHYARCIVAVAINRVQEFNDRWPDIIKGQQEASFPFFLDKNYSKDDSVKLISFICIARDLRDSYLSNSDQFEPGKIWHNVLSETLEFSARDTAPELSRHFCDLWNELIDVTQDSKGFLLMAKANAKIILSLASPVHRRLHQGATDDHPTLPIRVPYTRCDVKSHPSPEPSQPPHGYSVSKDDDAESHQPPPDLNVSTPSGDIEAKPSQPPHGYSVFTDDAAESHQPPASDPSVSLPGDVDNTRLQDPKPSQPIKGKGPAVTTYSMGGLGGLLQSTLSHALPRPVMSAAKRDQPLAIHDTDTSPGPTPSVFQSPDMDDTDTNSGPLTLAIRKALIDDSRYVVRCTTLLLSDLLWFPLHTGSGFLLWGRYVYLLTFTNVRS
jgi:hypothetical protein